MDVYKDKLPAGWAYALKPSMLASAIADAKIQSPVSLHQRYKSWEAGAQALNANFYPRGSYIGGEGGRFSVGSYAIPSGNREAVRGFAEGVFLPALVKWMVSIEALSPNSPIAGTEQRFVCKGSPTALSRRSIIWLPKGQPRRKQT